MKGYKYLSAAISSPGHFKM